MWTVHSLHCTAAVIDGGFFFTFSVGSKSAGHPGPSSTSESRDKRHQRTAATDQFATTGSFIAEESSPEACLMNASPTSGISARMMQRSTESLDSLSDESNHHRNRTPATRQVKQTDRFCCNYVEDSIQV